MMTLKNDDIIYLILTVFLTGAGYTDLKYKKVYNVWILPAVVLAAFIRGYSFFIWAGISIACSFILYMCRMVGAGDIKLVAYIYGLLGPESANIIVLIALSLATVYSAYLLISRKNLYTRLIYFKNFLDKCVKTKTIHSYYDINKDDKSLTIPLAQYFLIACIIRRIYDLCKIV